MAKMLVRIIYMYYEERIKHHSLPTFAVELLNGESSLSSGKAAECFRCKNNITQTLSQINLD